MGLVFCGEEAEEKERAAGHMQLLQLVFGKRKGHPFSLLVFIAPISVLRCLRVVLPYPCPFFGLSWASFYSNSPIGEADPALIFIEFSVSLPIQKSVAKNCDAADS